MTRANVVQDSHHEPFSLVAYEGQSSATERYLSTFSLNKGTKKRVDKLEKEVERVSERRGGRKRKKEQMRQTYTSRTPHTKHYTVQKISSSTPHVLSPKAQSIGSPTRGAQRPATDTCRADGPSAAPGSSCMYPAPDRDHFQHLHLHGRAQQYRNYPLLRDYVCK